MEKGTAAASTAGLPCVIGWRRFDSAGESGLHGPHVHAGSIPAFAFSHGTGVPCFNFTDGPAGMPGGDKGAGTDRPSVRTRHGTARRRKFAPW